MQGGRRSVRGTLGRSSSSSPASVASSWKQDVRQLFLENTLAIYWMHSCFCPCFSQNSIDIVKPYVFPHQKSCIIIITKFFLLLHRSTEIQRAVLVSSFGSTLCALASDTAQSVQTGKLNPQRCITPLTEIVECLSDLARLKYRAEGSAAEGAPSQGSSRVRGYVLLGSQAVTALTEVLFLKRQVIFFVNIVDVCAFVSYSLCSSTRVSAAQ